MRIANLTQEIDRGRARVRADVFWEDCDKPPFELFVETDEAFQTQLQPDPNAFLLATLLQAWQLGERRVQVDGALCPVLVHEIRGPLLLLADWYKGLGAFPAIEPVGTAVRQPATGKGVQLLSCGIDSLASLRKNQLLVPADHALATRAVLPVIQHTEPGAPLDKESGRLGPASRIADACGIPMMPAWTNLFHLNRDGYFSDQVSHGAQFSAVAMCFSAAYSRGVIASSADGRFLTDSWGSSPLLDPYYSAAHFQIAHHGAGMTRIEKVSLVADWRAGLTNIRVCQRDTGATANCGRCEKCISVMTQLLALGKLAHCEGAFPSDDVTEDQLQLLIDYMMIPGAYALSWYSQAVPGLRAQGREDLVRAIARVTQYFSWRF